MSRFSQIIRSLSTVSKNQIIDKSKNQSVFKMKFQTQFDINDENDHDTIKSIIYASDGSIYFDEKNGKFYFK